MSYGRLIGSADDFRLLLSVVRTIWRNTVYTYLKCYLGKAKRIQIGHNRGITGNECVPMDKFRWRNVSHNICRFTINMYLYSRGNKMWFKAENSCYFSVWTFSFLLNFCLEILKWNCIKYYNARCSEWSPFSWRSAKHIWEQVY